MDYFFQLRKDSSNQYNQSLLINSITAIKNEQRNGTISRNYINTLQSETNTLKISLQDKIDKSEIYTILNNYYSNMECNCNTSHVLKLIQEAQQKAINGINLVREQSIQELTTLNVKSEESADFALRQARNASASAAIASISATSAEASALSAAESNAASAALAITISETAATITAAIYNAMNLNKDLLEKIEYLFQFFYHSDSVTIMKHYPFH